MKKVLFTFLSFTSLLFLSCSNFLQGARLKEQLDEKIEIANSPTFIITINPLIPESIISITPSGNLETKKGKIINIEAKIHNDYTFVDWKIYSKKNGSEISKRDNYLKIGETETYYRETEIVKKVSIEILSLKEDLEIAPYCVPKSDIEGPKFTGEFNVANSKQDLENGKIFTLAEFDSNGKLIKKEANRANQLSFDIFVYDNVKPSKVLIKEIPFRNELGADVDVLNPGANEYSEVIKENCFVQYQKKVFEAKFNYEFQLKRDDLLLIQIKAIDESDNVSEETKSFIVSKDTTAGNISIFTCSDDNNYYNRATAERLNYAALQEERKTIHWKPVIDQYVNFIGTEGKIELIEENIESFELKYGYSEDCSEGTVVLQSHVDSVFTHKSYEYNKTDRAWFLPQGSDTKFDEESFTSCSYKLPDYLFKEDKDIYLRVTIKDSIGNVNTYKTVLLGKPEKPMINYVNSGPSRAEDGGQSWGPIIHIMTDSDYETKYLNYFENIDKSICYRVFFSKESVINNFSEKEIIKETSFYDNSQMKHNEVSWDTSKGIIRFNFAEISNSILKDYDEAKQGDVLGYYYLQAGVTDYNTQFLSSDLLEVPIIKGQIFAEPISSKTISYSDFQKLFYLGKTEGKIPGSPDSSWSFGFKHEIKIPTEYEEYNWHFYYPKPTFLYGEKEDYVPMNFDNEKQVYYFWQKENINTNVIAEAYDNSGHKIYSFNITFYAAGLELDHKYPYNFGNQYISPVENLDYSKFPSYIDYGQFTLSNYAGSGIKIVVYDETGISKDKTNNSFIDVQFLPVEIYKNRYCMWDDGYDTYNKYRLYEKPYFYGTERDSTVKNNELHDFIIPLYLFEEGKVVNCINSMKDSTPEENSNRDFVGIFDWTRIENTADINYGNSVCNIKDTIELNSSEFDENNTSLYSFTVEKFNTEENLWKKDYSNYDYSKMNNQYSITSQGSFYRARSSNAKYEGTLNVDGYYHLSFTPTHYFFDTKVEIQEGFVTQGINAIQITLTQPALVQTYYANKNLGNKLSEWELQASDVNAKVYDPAKNDSTVLYFYDDNEDVTQQVPDNYYYIVAVYFANGKSICTSVMQK